MQRLHHDRRAAEMRADFEDGMPVSVIAIKHKLKARTAGRILASVGVLAPDEEKALASSLDAYNAVKAALFQSKGDRQ